MCWPLRILALAGLLSGVSGCAGNGAGTTELLITGGSYDARERVVFTPSVEQTSSRDPVTSWEVRVYFDRDRDGTCDPGEELYSDHGGSGDGGEGFAIRSERVAVPEGTGSVRWTLKVRRASGERSAAENVLAELD